MDGVVDEGDDRYGSCEGEEELYDRYDHDRDICHGDITISEFLTCDTTASEHTSSFISKGSIEK